MQRRALWLPIFIFSVVMTSVSISALAVEKGGLPAICLSDSSTLPVEKARLLAFGDYRGPSASRNAEAQRFFDQAMVFGWGFNFAEAVRSFRAAARIDLDCALCRWGVAWALGPSINHDMKPADVPVAIDAIVQARSGVAAGSRDRALIDALAKRYSVRRGADADALALSYAAAMAVLADRYSDDADVAVLAAEATMNAHAYDYWRADGKPQPWTPQIIGWLDRALAIAPSHPGAHHYRIHLFEDSRQPERALASSQRLGALAPMVGHLVHMPSHIFFRLGLYHDAAAANDAAVRADREYAAATGTVSDYAIHNLHFLWASALWGSDRARAAGAAGELAAAAAAAPFGAVNDATRQHFLAAPYLTRVSLREWSLLLLPSGSAESAGNGPYLQGLTHFANGMARAASGDIASAGVELDSLRRAARATRSAGLMIKSINRASDALSVGSLQLQSAIAAARGLQFDALRFARAAVAAEDRLARDDPPLWPLPSRHLLGEALLRADRAAEASSVYGADLKKYPHNCAALAGVAAAAHVQRAASASTASSAQASALSSHCPE